MKPRYDPDEDISRHAATHRSCCKGMAEKYDWELIAVEKTNDLFFKVDCVFKGRTEFPKSYYNGDTEED